jgi:hypothetical protein
MDAGGLSHMTSNFNAGQMGLPTSGLASRRGGQNIKPLSFDTLNAATERETVPTPRTSRGHLLAGLRTAPKSAAAAAFPASPTSLASPTPMFGRNNIAHHAYANPQANAYGGGPKTALPALASQQGFGSLMGMSQHYTPEQVLAPPQIRIDEHEQDPQLYAQLVATNAYLAQQQQQLQQQLLNVQAAAQQLQGLSISPVAQQQMQQQQMALYQQQQHLRNIQQQMALSAMGAQPNIYAYVDPATGQQTYYVDQSAAAAAAQLQSRYAMDQAHAQAHHAQAQAAAHAYQQMPQSAATPRVQVSPPPEHHASPFRSNSPPKRYESPSEHTPLPPPSANAFRRGHKKASSLAVNSSLTVSTNDAAPKSAGPRSVAFPLTPLTGGFAPGHGRAGEHPVRQPRGPPPFDELSAKPTARHEGSKNFAARTRRSAVHNLVRAGLERRKGTGSSSGSMSPVSETAEDSTTPITDNESDSGHSGSGSLSGDVECSLPSSRTSTSGSWGAIGSDRPGSRQKARKSVDSISSATSGCESDTNTGSANGSGSSFASVFKHGAQRAAKGADAAETPRKSHMLVLTSADKRKAGNVA